MTNENALSPKERAFISISASVAAGCRPCTEHHVRGGREAGLCDRSIGLAIGTAVAVRENATRSMQAFAGQCAGAPPKLEEEFIEQKRLISELAGVAAAAAVHSVPDLEARVATARQAGATPQQIRTALAIAVSIRNTASAKVDAAAGEETAPAESCCAPSACGCSR